mgnify:CR=1 FL=1
MLIVDNDDQGLWTKVNGLQKLNFRYEQLIKAS